MLAIEKKLIGYKSGCNLFELHETIGIASSLLIATQTLIFLLFPLIRAILAAVYLLWIGQILHYIKEVPLCIPFTSSNLLQLPPHPTICFTVFCLLSDQAIYHKIPSTHIITLYFINAAYFLSDIMIWSFQLISMDDYQAQ